MHSVSAIPASRGLLSILPAEHGNSVRPSAGAKDFSSVLQGMLAGAPAPAEKSPGAPSASAAKAGSSVEQIAPALGNFAELLGFVGSILSAVIPETTGDAGTTTTGDSGTTTTAGSEADTGNGLNETQIQSLAAAIGERFELGDYCQVFTNQSLLAYLFGNQA